MEDIRSFNVGASDYAKHKYQSWDFWIKFRLNPFDADICKRTLRTKATDGRVLDYQKIKHICGERLRQLNEGEDVFKPIHYFETSIPEFKEMLADYNLCSEDQSILFALIYNVDRRAAYTTIQNICDKRIEALSKSQEA